MGKEKRKTRLNKGEAGTFVGFGVFADVASPQRGDKDDNHPATTNAIMTKQQQPLFRLTPAYVGTDATLHVLFPRIGQKRDATTKVKALSELHHSLFAASTVERKTKVEALCHLLYLYHSKLFYDDSPQVRAHVLECCQSAQEGIPKAWKALVNNNDDVEDTAFLAAKLWCARADPSTIVRQAASSISLQDPSTPTANSNNTLMRQVWNHVRRIVMYGKASTMYQDLLPSAPAYSQLSDRQKEEWEERFEQVVATAMGGLTLCLQEQTIHDVTSEDARVFWKTMTSPKYTLRRQTYNLVSTMCQHAPLLVDRSKMTKLLAQTLSSEKEPTNIPILLQTLLTFCIHVMKEERTEIMATHYAKPLTKLFAKGCHGATSRQWAPTVLPLVALLPADKQAVLLTSVWEGRQHVVGIAHQLVVAGAVAETACFALIKEGQQSDYAEVLAKSWMHALQFVLQTESKGGAMGQALQDVTTSLAKDLQKLALATHTKPTSAIAGLGDVFWVTEWQQALSNHLRHGMTNLTTLLASVPIEDLHVWNVLQRSLVSKVQELRGSCEQTPPTRDIYQFWSTVLERIPIDDVFSDRNKFVTNDVLRWIILHTSSLSSQQHQSAELAQQDFVLLSAVMKKETDEPPPPPLWNTILQEMKTAQCDLHMLISCLDVLVQQGVPKSVFCGSVLTEFCLDVAKEWTGSVESVVNDDSSETTESHLDRYVKASDFIQVCLGVGDLSVGALVGEDTIHQLMELACPSGTLVVLEMNPVLEALTLLARTGGLPVEQVQRVLLQSWRLGGSVWNEALTSWLQNNKESLQSFISLSSKELQSTMRQAASEKKTDHNFARLWSERGGRLLLLCQDNKPSLSLLGLDDAAMWRRNDDTPAGTVLIEALLRLLEGVADASTRMSLFLNSQSEDHLELLVRVAICLSGASLDILRSEEARTRRDDCAKFIGLLGLKDAPIEDRLQWVDTLTAILSRNEGSREGSCRGVALLSQILALCFIRLSTEPSDDNLNPDDVKKGDTVWYLSNPQKPSDRQECTVVKIHNDMPEELYFTVQMKNGEHNERQTVLGRLRSKPFQSAMAAQNKEVSVDCLDDTERKRRNKVATDILNGVLIPHWESLHPEMMEVVSVAVCQAGLFGERGIGSDTYNLLDRLMKAQTKTSLLLQAPTENVEAMVSELWKLTKALGFGCSVPVLQNTARLLGFDVEQSLSMVSAYYEVSRTTADRRLDEALTALLSITAPHLESKQKKDEAYLILFKLASKLLSEPGYAGFRSGDLIALRALEIAQNSHHSMLEVEVESDFQREEGSAICGFVKSFSSRWYEDCTFRSSQFGEVKRLLDSSIHKRPHLVAAAVRNASDDLIGALFKPDQREYSMLLLGQYASAGIPLHEIGSGMNELTQAKVDSWCRDLIDSEAEELREDIENVVQWVPARLLNEMEGWAQLLEGTLQFEPSQLCGQACCWLAFLDIVRVAAGKDSYNRPALVSYVKKSKAVEFILALVTTFGDIGSERKPALDKVVDLSHIMSRRDSSGHVEFSKIAALCLYHTVEVFPAIAKHWWEQCCPKYFSQAVCEFVENKVSPLILRGELERIRKETSFGAMTVTGNAVTREVVASYVQDEFTLSVVIKTPLSFPFRRAEVDCSKTLGVPVSRWKRWALQITQMLNNQGGSLKDALMLWKENVDKEFEGIEPCPVCYSVLHVKTHKLPELQCKNCSYRFHHACLMQWFNSSGKNACVMCQQPWSGTRVS